MICQLALLKLTNYTMLENFISVTMMYTTNTYWPHEGFEAKLVEIINEEEKVLWQSVGTSSCTHKIV